MAENNNKTDQVEKTWQARAAAVLDAEAQRARERRERAINDVVEALEFTLRERTIYNGVPALVITFSPKAHARPTTRQGRTAQQFAGTVWVDERSAEVMHLQATSIADISYGLGIVARLGKGTTATVTRKPLGDERPQRAVHEQQRIARTGP